MHRYDYIGAWAVAFHAYGNVILIQLNFSTSYLCNNSSLVMFYQISFMYMCCA